MNVNQTISLEKLRNDALQILNQVSDSPQKRYDLRVEFYNKYGHPYTKGSEGLGNSELAFMQWEIRRGVLNPLNAPQPGSKWWRSVNGHFIYLSTLADLIKQSGQQFENLEAPVQFWLDYINSANELTWYRAHNSSIIAGYVKSNDDAFAEITDEQYFMNIVLYRLLYAQSMVEGVSFGILGKIFGNPRGKAVSIITDIDSFYPRHYPLTKEEMKYVTHHAHNIEGILEDFFDEILILPELNRLYEEASKWDQSKVLTSYVKNNKPIYPLTSSITDNKIHFRDLFADRSITTL